MKKQPTLSNDTVRAENSDAFVKRLDRHFVLCSVALGAAAAAVGASTRADGAIIYSGTQNFAVPANNVGGVYIDFDAGTVSLSGSAGADANLFDFVTATTNGNYNLRYLGAYGPNHAANGALTNGSQMALRLSAGQLIGAAGPFENLAALAYQFRTLASAPLGPIYGQWNTTGTSFLGFRFVDANGQTDFGWIRISFNAGNFTGNGSAATIVDWGWDNSGAAIMAGAVPEPSSLGLAFLAGGAAGLMAWRRSRQAKAA
jgi:hypothetical protein